jgi:palmitoyltransferase
VSQTVVLILYAQFVLVTVVLLPWYGFTIHIPLFTTLMLLALISHCRAQFTDPGSVPWDRVPPPPTAADTIAPGTLGPDGRPLLPALPPRVCRRCRTLKPWKAHHCSTCQRCMVRMDHHCPWVNNCVAIYNQKYFLLFLVYICLCCVYCGTMLVLRFISCTHNLKSCSVSGAQAVLCVLLFIESVIFGLFCAIMLWDQLSAIFENTPGIDALQNRKGASRGRYESLKEVFGEPLCWRWWLPLNLPASMKDDFEREMLVMDDEESERILQEQAQARWEEQQAQAQVAAATAQAAAATAHATANAVSDAVHGGHSHNGKACNHSHGKNGSHSGNGSGNGRGPIVFPSGFSPSDHQRALAVAASAAAGGSFTNDLADDGAEYDDDDEDDEHDNPLAALQSPPRSPTLLAQRRGGAAAAASNHAQQQQLPLSSKLH